jgi:hypothetical protein
MKAEDAQLIKQQALKSIGARANNPNAPGISMVRVTPHQALELVEAWEKQNNGSDQQQAVP